MLGGLCPLGGHSLTFQCAEGLWVAAYQKETPGSGNWQAERGAVSSCVELHRAWKPHPSAVSKPLVSNGLFSV